MYTAQREEYSDLLRFSVDSALTYTCTESQVDDWVDTHTTTAKLIIQLQRHAEAVAKHLSVVNKAETTKDLRQGIEEELNKGEQALEEHKRETEDEFAMVFRKNEDLQKYIKQVQDSQNEFRKYTEDMQEPSLLDLVPGLTADDIKPDTQGVNYVIEADPEANAKAKQSRMFTLDQL